MSLVCCWFTSCVRLPDLIAVRDPIPQLSVFHGTVHDCRALALSALRRHTISPAGVVGMGMGVAERLRHIRAAGRDMAADPPPPPPAAAMAPAQLGEWEPYKRSSHSSAAARRDTGFGRQCSLLPQSAVHVVP